MAQALYRKWRPASFDDVVGQEHVTTTLKNQIATDRIGHAYLFVGSRGCGKTTLSRPLLRDLDPTTGNVFFEGRNVWPASEKSSRKLSEIPLR